jgi:MFS family permease
MIAFSYTSILPLAMVILFIAGAGMVNMVASSNTILQKVSDEDKRGRVMSFWSLTAGISTFGNLIYGSLASAIGAQRTVTIGGCCVVIGALIFSREMPELSKILRPIYIKRGIIKELEKGIEAADNPTGPISSK